MYKLVNVKDIALPKWLTNMGDHNHLPIPNLEINEDEFYRTISSKCITHLEFRQISYDGKPVRNSYIHWFYDSAIAVLYPNNWGISKDGKFYYKEKPQYFLIGCNHNYIQTHSSGMLHYLECTLCGQKSGYDSSG